MAISHDRLFKELLRTFLWEFLELFVPELIPHLERKPLRFVESEVFDCQTRPGLQEGLSLVLQARFGDSAGSLATRLSAADAKQLKRLKAKTLTASLADLEKLL